MNSVSDGELKALRESGLFDEQWYREQYPDVSELKMDPVEHYLWLGASLHRNPSQKFSTSKYLEFHADVKSANINPLLHYIKSGRKEGRRVAEVPVIASERMTCDRVINRRLLVWDHDAEKALLSRLNDKSGPVSDISVSIIMPTFNRADCISNAIQSVLSQTHTNWELIVSDDGSTDNTSEIVQGFNNPKIIYFKSEMSGGVSKARNLGLHRSTGQWVFFLDSDNTWHPSYLETMLRFVSYHGLRAAYCGAELKGDRNQNKGYLFAEFEFESCLKNNYIDLNTFCTTAELAKVGFDESLRRLVDWDYILRIASQTPMRAAQFIGVTYYDGDQHNRITRSEYRDLNHLNAIMTKIRQNAKRSIQTNAARLSNRKRVAVVLHIYHVHHLEECLRYIGNITEKFDLYITSNFSESDATIREIKRRYPDAISIQYPNIGFDIGPFLSLISTLCSYDLVCKVHAKRDVPPWGGTWRTTMLNALLGSPELVDRIIAEFRADGDLGAVGPKDYFKDVETRSSPGTYYRTLALSDACGFGSAAREPFGFFAGTAFAGQVAYALGFTGQGVSASRFAALTMLDLIEGKQTERTALRMLRRRPVPFPPEPFCDMAVRWAQRDLAHEDETGRRSRMLRTFDRLGVGPRIDHGLAGDATPDVRILLPGHRDPGEHA